MDRVFQALASTPRRKILAYLAHAELSAGDIAARFDMSLNAVSKHIIKVLGIPATAIKGDQQVTLERQQRAEAQQAQAQQQQLTEQAQAAGAAAPFIEATKQ